MTKLLPVLPVQLDANIPLADNSAPVVEAVKYTTEGIYVTFSKYMTDTGGGDKPEPARQWNRHQLRAHAYGRDVL